MELCDKRSPRMKGVMKVNTEMGRYTEEPNDKQKQTFVAGTSL